jgi:hypothetical protein
LRLLDVSHYGVAILRCIRYGRDVGYFAFDPLIEPIPRVVEGDDGFLARRGGTGRGDDG